MRQALKPASLTVFARAAIIAVCFALDRLSKYWAVTYLKPRFLIEIFPFFRFTYVENTGMAFGLGYARNRLFLTLSTALLIVLIYLQKAWSRKNLWIQIGLLLVIAGALGNICDRISYGHVVDFLDLRLFGFDVFNVFNGADSFISVGAVSLGIGLLQEDAEEKRAGKAAS